MSQMNPLELIEFHDRLFLKVDTQIYVFESNWDAFRPIECVGWNGVEYEIVDSKYKKDLFSEWYGYESFEQKQQCKLLLDKVEFGSPKRNLGPIDFWKFCKTPTVFWKDRFVVFTSSCVPRHLGAWKKYLRYLDVRARTLRKPLQSQTRRLVNNKSKRINIQ